MSSLLLLLTVSSQTTNGTFMLHLRTESIFPMLTGLFQVCAKQNAQVFGLILF